ncbi:MAG: N-6 DNA methylase [Candidatus Eisenbacteria bacterium]
MSKKAGKKSKLREKPTRMPDVNAAKHEWAISTYLESLPAINSESARSHRFTVLLETLFGVEPGFIEEYVRGIEKFLNAKGKDRILRGRADQLSGNLIIEFEKDLSPQAKIEEAEDQLRLYVSCIWSEEPLGARTKYVCLATDGRRFRAYAPTVGASLNQELATKWITLTLLEDLDAQKVRWDDFYFFLDRYLLRKEILHPTSALIVKDFGPRSHAFQVAKDALLVRWDEVRDHPDYTVLYEAWDKYLRIVYGSAIADDELFIRHTYLATLAKLMVWARLAAKPEPPTAAEALAILEGRHFKEQLGIENFLEEDFFSWIARSEAKQTATEIAHMLLGLLRNYNLREISEDVLKSLYEGLVDPETRHDLGEYYTPDWLAHRIVRKLLAPNPKASVLDPACGSGTFLYMTIREKRHLLGDSARTLKHILSEVVGLDIHPLACIVAKANYVLALGDLMVKRKHKIAIPVYLANSIRPPELELERGLWQQVSCYRTEIDGRRVHIPEALIHDSVRYDEAVEACRDYALHAKGRPTDPEAFERFLKTNQPGLVSDEQTTIVLCSVAETLKLMIETGRDTIWAFVLKNIYKPLFLRDRFDLVVGNPPWLSYRHIERSDYQVFLKEQVTQVYGLLKGRGELVTHLELGTLFLVRAAHLYLKKGGAIGFVLPKSIFSADQHDALRRNRVEEVKLRTTELWDLEPVTPLFKTSSAVYFGEKSRKAAPDPIPGEVLEGKLDNRNADLKTAEKTLSHHAVMYSLSTMGNRSFWSSGDKVAVAESSYRKLFREGATIVPRCFWFVEVKKSQLGFDENLPPLISSERARKEAKKAYRDCVIEGPVESKFIYATLLPVDMVPFGVLRFRTIVLPALIEEGQFRLYRLDDARRHGYLHLSRWMEQVEAEWAKRRSKKLKDVDSIDWLDYRRKLTQQNPNAGFRVLYGTSGTHVCACAVSPSMKRRRKRGIDLGQALVIDHQTYSFDPESAEEASYLASVLNAPAVNLAIKEGQSRGLWGARHVHKKVLDLPIPKFDAKVEAHVRLAEIGEACAQRVEEWIAAGGPGNIKSIGLLRRRVREMLAAELVEIDSIVKPLLGL